MHREQYLARRHAEAPQRGIAVLDCRRKTFKTGRAPKAIRPPASEWKAFWWTAGRKQRFPISKGRKAESLLGRRADFREASCVPFQAP
jgi:hypothetical protein